MLRIILFNIAYLYILPDFFVTSYVKKGFRVTIDGLDHPIVHRAYGMLKTESSLIVVILSRNQ